MKAAHREPPVPCEWHHILPKSMGGSNRKINKVALTGREHFIAHLLLVRCTVKPARLKMVRALVRMRKHANTAIKYQIFSRLISENSRGPDNPSFGKVWSHDPRDGAISYTKRDSIPENHILGLPLQRGGNGPGSKWCNNGIIETMIQNNDKIPAGMKPGRLNQPSIEQLRRASAARHQPHKDRRHASLIQGRTCIAKDGKFKRVTPKTLEEYLRDGWVRHTQVLPHHRALMIEGVRYATRREAAQAHGIHQQTVGFRVRNAAVRWATWAYA